MDRTFVTPCMLQRLGYNFSLKRRVAIDVYIKVVGQITSFLMNGKTSLKKFSTRSYDHYNKKV